MNSSVIGLSLNSITILSVHTAVTSFNDNDNDDNDNDNDNIIIIIIIIIIIWP